MFVAALAGALLTLWGAFLPWAPHKAAGLTILGLDLAEYVKFLPAVATGQVVVWRLGFYAPLLAASLTLSLTAFRLPTRRWDGPSTALRAAIWLLRLLLVIGSMVAAFNLLPPAWSPPLLRTAEFRTQSAVMVALVALALVSPLLALLPRRLAAALIGLVALTAAALPVFQYLRVRPLIEALYASPLPLGAGVWVTLGGCALMAAAAMWIAVVQRPPTPATSGAPQIPPLKANSA